MLAPAPQDPQLIVNPLQWTDLVMLKSSHFGI